MTNLALVFPLVLAAAPQAFSPDPEALSRIGSFKAALSAARGDLAASEEELSKLLGRRVDLNTPGFLSPYFRDRVLAEAEIQYVQP